jgi:bifunctional UDP-N-acetylglucosamine pyrophosphorylase/glucosamine-1-phosphate N-acetyltransferase
MGSEQPKVVHSLNGRPMIAHVLDTVADLGFGTYRPDPVVVVGFGADAVRDCVDHNVCYALQTEQLGTGDAGTVGLGAASTEAERILLIHGDEPLISASTYRQMLDLQTETTAAVVLLTGLVSDAQGLGRVFRDEHGQIVALVQEKELTPDQRKILEINFGAYVFDRSFMQEMLPMLEKHPGGEYYLTDLIAFAVGSGRIVQSVQVPYPDDQMGINDQAQLERAALFLRNGPTGRLQPSRGI